MCLAREENDETWKIWIVDGKIDVLIALSVVVRLLLPGEAQLDPAVTRSILNHTG